MRRCQSTFATRKIPLLFLFRRTYVSDGRLVSHNFNPDLFRRLRARGGIAALWPEGRGGAEFLARSCRFRLSMFLFA